MKFTVLLLISFLAMILTPQVSIAQDHYIVKGKVVNVRSGPGVDYGILSSYKAGDKIIVFNITDNWAKVKISDTEYGYISLDYITKGQQYTNDINAQDFDEKERSNFTIGLYVILGILVIWFFIRFSRRCDKCGKWNAIREVDKEVINTKNSTIKKVEKLTDTKGEEHQNVNYLPATIYTYRIYKQCRRCGYKFNYTETEKKEN